MIHTYPNRIGADANQTTLLKEYIKTLVAVKGLLPEVTIRKWGEEFNRSELKAIHSCLKALLETTNQEMNQEMVYYFQKIGKRYMHLHWFVYQYWQTIIQLLAKQSAVFTQLSLH